MADLFLYLTIRKHNKKGILNFWCFRNGSLGAVSLDIASLSRNLFMCLFVRLLIQRLIIAMELTETL